MSQRRGWRRATPGACVVAVVRLRSTGITEKSRPSGTYSFGRRRRLVSHDDIDERLRIDEVPRAVGAQPLEQAGGDRMKRLIGLPIWL